MTTYKLRHESNDIPDNESGIYLFKLRFPTLYSVGINDNALEKNVEPLIEIIETFSKVINNIKINNRISNKKGLMLINAYSISLEPVTIRTQKKKLISIIREKNIDELKSLINMLRYAVAELPPIYVGITEKQSFRQRYTQHFNGESNFKEGIEALGLSWDWLNFVTFSQTEHNIENHREVEQIFHLLLKPLLSRG